MKKKLNIYYAKLLLIFFIYILLNYKFNNNNILSLFTCNHNYHKVKEINPTEISDGIIYLICGLCGKIKRRKISRLNRHNYFIEDLKINYGHENGKKYIYKKDKNIIYEKNDNKKENHTIYGGKCEICNKTIGEFDFHKLSDFHCYGYPRLYLLSEYWNNTWLLGGDNGTILCHRSNDSGLTWSEPSIVSNLTNYFCSNVDFFELPNHDIICSYRAIGKETYNNSNVKYNRKICSSISKDGGKTWHDLGLIVDNFILAQRLGKTMKDAIKAVKNESNIGFFEPFVQYFNNKITVIYADDFTPMLLLLSGSVKESRKEQSIYSHTYDIEKNEWSIKRKLIMNGYIKKSPTNSGLNKKISRDGMPVTDIMKDGTYVMIFEGTYRREEYNYFTGGTLEEYHPFEIVLSYSKDGEIWSNPIEIYHGHNNGSKYSAPYICVTKSDQLIISFQTDENSINSGFKGDKYSIMKVIISKPGIPIDKINKDSFFAVTNNNKSPIGGASLWSGMMLIGNIIYTCSSGHVILYSELPLYDDPNKYNSILREKYQILSGDVDFYGNKIITKGRNNLIISNEFILNSSINIYTNIIPQTPGECGIIFGFNKSNNDNFNYFFFSINQVGNLTLVKKEGDILKKLYPDNDSIYNNFNKENVYKMNIRFNFTCAKIKFYINEVEIYQLSDNSFFNSKIGLLSSYSGSIFTQLLSE